MTVITGKELRKMFSDRSFIHRPLEERQAIELDIYLMKHKRTVEQEVELIKQKKSNLSASMREFVIKVNDIRK